MTAIANFAFEEHLVRIVDRDGEPWFAGKDVCGALGIRDYHQALENLDQDERGGCSVPTPSGEQTMIVVSEPGVYRLVFRSRKPEAERFKRWLAHEVLPQIRKTGHYGIPRDAEKPVAVDRDAPLAARVEAIRLAARLYGRERARHLWVEMGLPPVPHGGEAGPAPDGRACLALLLAHVPVGAAQPVRELIAAADAGDVAARDGLLAIGVRLSADGCGVLVANVSAGLERAFDGTQWAGRGWRDALRALPGATSTGVIRFQVAGRQSRATWLPFSLVE